MNAVMEAGFYTSHLWLSSVFMALSAVVVWFFGVKLNDLPARELVDPKPRKRSC